MWQSMFLIHLLFQVMDFVIVSLLKPLIVVKELVVSGLGHLNHALHYESLIAITER